MVLIMSLFSHACEYANLGAVTTGQLWSVCPAHIVNALDMIPNTVKREGEEKEGEKRNRKKEVNIL